MNQRETTPGTARTRPAAQRRREFIEELRAERLAQSQSAPRPKERAASRLAQLRAEDRQAQQAIVADTRREEESRAASRREQQQEEARGAQLRQRQFLEQSAAARAPQEELPAGMERNQPEEPSRASQLRENQRLARQIEAALARQKEPSRSSAPRKRRDEESPSAKARAPLEPPSSRAVRPKGEEESYAAAQPREEEEPSRAARLRERQRLVQEAEALRSQAEEQPRAARPSKLQESEPTAHAVVPRPEPRLTRQTEEARARQESELPASARRRKQVQLAQQDEEIRAALLRKEQRKRQVEKQQPEAIPEPAEPEPQPALRTPAPALPSRAEVRSQRQQEAEAAIRRRDTRRQRMEQRQPAPQVEASAASRLTRRAEARSIARVEEVPPEEPVDELLRLKTDNSFVADDNGDAVTLRGVTVRGLDTLALPQGQTFPDALALDDRNLSVLTGLWHANLVRVPFQAQTILDGAGALSPADILAGLDEVVAAVAAAGAYVLLALEAPAGGATPLAPDTNALQVWQQLAQHYEAEPGVLYEVFASASSLASNWLQEAANLVATIRQQNASALVFLGSGSGDVSVAGLPLRLSTGASAVNIVYTINVSPAHHPLPDDGDLRALTESYPVFAAEWSNGETDFGRLSGYVADLLERYGIGWAAANWNADPRLVVDAAHHDFTPTGWGLIVQRALTLPARPLLKPFRATAAGSTVQAGNV